MALNAKTTDMQTQLVNALNYLTAAQNYINNTTLPALNTDQANYGIAELTVISTVLGQQISQLNAAIHALQDAAAQNP